MSKPQQEKDIANMLGQAAQKAKYSLLGLKALSYEQFRNIMINHPLVSFARVTISDEILNCIILEFRNILHDYINEDTDRIVNVFAKITGGVQSLLLKDYIKKFILISALHGDELAAHLLISWVDGEKLKYNQVALIDGIDIQCPLYLKQGIRIYKLPSSLSDIRAYLPYGAEFDQSLSKFFNGIVLSVEVEAGPVFYLSSKECWEDTKPIKSFAKGYIKNLSFKHLCQALSLAANHCIDYEICWLDLGKLKVFQTSGYSCHGNSLSPTRSSNIKFTQKHFEEALHIYKLRETLNDKMKTIFETVIPRWMKSKSSKLTFSDQLIELRITLEILFLSNGNINGELKFRLATRGAWYVGQNTEERKNYRNILHKAYNLASKAIHGSNVKNTGKNEELLNEAQTICREGILKVLRNKTIPNWDDLIMGE